jgi:hypothetical protein
MKAKKLLTVLMLVVSMGLIAGCHEEYRGYNNSYGYRDGFRDGRAYERRQNNWNDSPYRYGYYGRRW